MLKIEGKNLPFVRFGDSAQTRVGDWVVAIGNPYGLGGTVTAGIVSALHRNIGSGPSDRYIQTDASINQGNSGGPMFDMNGNVVGINTAIFSPTGGNVGIGFAIPSEVAAAIIETLKSGGKVKGGYLGFGIQPLDEGAADALGLAKNQGELIARVEPNEAAAKAGIREGDVVVRLAGRAGPPAARGDRPPRRARGGGAGVLVRVRVGRAGGRAGAGAGRGRVARGLSPIHT